MIHLTVAAPLGIDSLFFSFVQRLAVQNGHLCVDPPAEQLDSEEPGHWIDALGRSAQHHFVIGYRYPPRYWPQLVEHAATVAVLADGDGIVRQVQRMHRQEQKKGEGKEIEQCLHGIRHAVDAMVGITEWLLSEASPSRLLPPAVAFQADAGGAFHRLECFYKEAGVPVSTSCSQGFSTEAQPLLDQIQPASADVRRAIQRLLSLEESTPTRLNAVGVLFGHEG